ncbi:MAG: hypothetical protein AB2L20_23085 [Mangrovibacterium sp.]
MAVRQIELKKLDKFVGRWKTEGKVFATDTTSEKEISGTDTYEWLPEAFFYYTGWMFLSGTIRMRPLKLLAMMAERKLYPAVL